MKKKQKAVKSFTKKSLKKSKKTKVTKKPKKITKKISKKPIKSKTKSKKIWITNFETIKKRIENSLNKLKKDVKRKAPIELIEKDNNELLMLLGKCNYVVREFHAHQIKKEKKKKYF